MDAVGSLELSWCQGYNGSRVHYIDKDAFCYLSGSNVKFIAEDGAETVYNFIGNGASVLAVHSTNCHFAIAEQCLDPQIYVFAYPTYRQISILKDGAKLEFSNLAFSNSDYLASVSGLPEFELVLWNYKTGLKLSSIKLSPTPLTSLSFNPANWRHICAISESEILVLQTEQCDTKYVLQPKKSKLPPEDPQLSLEEEKERVPTRESTRMTRYTVDIPKAAIAGLVGEISERLEEIQDETVRVTPFSHSWTASGDIYVGCLGGQLLKINGETFNAKVIYFPPPRAETPHSRAVSASSKRPSMVDMPTITEDVSTLLLDGSVDCIGVHRNGLYAVGQDGVLRLVDLKGDECRVVEQCIVGVSVVSLAFSPSYKRIVLASNKGTLHLYDAGFADSLRLLKDIHYGNFVGIGCLPGNDYLVTIREDGELQVWEINKGLVVSAMSVGFQATCLVCSPLMNCAVVGTVTGHLYFIDLLNIEQPRIVHSIRVFTSPVFQLVFNQDGKYLFTGSDEGHFFILGGKASKQFQPIGHTDVPGEVQSISVFDGKSSLKVMVACNTSGNKRNGSDTLVQLEIREDIMADPKKLYKSLKRDLNGESVKKMTMKLASPSYGAAITKGSIVYTLSQKSKKLNYMKIPEEIPGKGKSIVLEPEDEFPGHQLPGGMLKMSPHQKWLITYGTDGAVQLKLTGSLDKCATFFPHDFRSGGVRDFVFSGDCQSMFTTGYDGVLTCYNWNLTNTGANKVKSAAEDTRARRTQILSEQTEEEKVLKDMDEWLPTFASRPSSAVADKEDKEKLARETAIQSDDIYSTPTPVAAGDSTWLQIQLLEAHKQEDKQYTELKNDIRIQIRDMRRTIQDMMRKNENLPEIEKLGRHEFDLDIEEQNRLQGEAEAEIQRVREDIEFENLAKMFLREMIKKECWDDMKVKGRIIQSFGSSLEVSNFPLKERTAAALRMLDTVTKRRQIEMQELAARKEEADMIQKPATTADDEQLEGEEANGQKKEMPATTGSLGAQYGGDSDLFISQFDLHTREQKISQITLLEDAIYRIKIAFNKDFDEVYRKKEQEIGKTKEKNKRIVKIMRDLDLNEPLVEPVMSVLEKPELLLTVEDREIKVEKYLTPEQKKKQEELQKIEEERRLREGGDNARERALSDMMGGVLEIKKEDELKKDIPKPAAIMAKPQEEWSEEDIKIVKEYEKRVKDLQEEREKYRKQLETELRKLQSLINESMTAFDDALNTLFLRKIKVMMVIYQEELKILRLRSSLLVEEELDTREKELNRLLEHKKQLKLLASQAYLESRKHVDAYRELYDNLVAEDKLTDKGFKREFSDVSAVVQDQLYRLFRRRPRIPKLRGGLETSGTTVDQKGPNPFADRPSTAQQNTHAKVAMESAIEDMDKEVNMPDGLDNSIWERLCAYRREKIESEQMVRQKALILAEMNAFMQARHDEDENLKDSIDDVLDMLNKVKEDKQRYCLNLEVQLLLKQGQVEVDGGSFINDYTDSVLLHRSVIEDLNSNIKQLGESKIASMVESKDFRMGIIQLEWEQKRMLMQMEDLQKKTKDVQSMKVSREIQLYLTEKDYEGKKAEEISKLEQSILVLKKHHEKNVEEKSKTLKDIKRTIKQKENENQQVEKQLEDMNVSVNERRHIDEVNADRRTDTGAEKRYQEIVQRRKLVDLAKAQAQEVAVLRAEVERLRMRTFPALVQVEH